MAYPCYVLLNELVCGCEGWAHPLCFPLTQKTCPLCEQPLRTRRELQLEKDPTRGFLDQLELARDTSPDVLNVRANAQEQQRRRSSYKHRALHL